MIEKWSGTYTPTCDICGETLPPEGTWQDARNAIRDAGWTIQKGGDGHYEHICPECENGGE